MDIQGKQYTKKEFRQLNERLERPVGELNCKHFAYPVVIGVSSPSYSRKQLKELRKESTRKIEYEGKTYTAYEATQVQRRLETQIRQQKENKLIGNDKIIKESNAKIRALTTGEELTVLGAKDIFYKVKIDANIGYVRAKNLSIVLSNKYATGLTPLT